jgi:hypothetical protein
MFDGGCPVNLQCFAVTTGLASAQRDGWRNIAITLIDRNLLPCIAPSSKRLSVAAVLGNPHSDLRKIQSVICPRKRRKVAEPHAVLNLRARPPRETKKSALACGNYAVTTLIVSPRFAHDLSKPTHGPDQRLPGEPFVNFVFAGCGITR